MSYYLTFDIGGTNLKYALMSSAGKIVEKDYQPTPQDAHPFWKIMKTIIQNYNEKICGIAICCPGKIENDKGIVHYGGALPFLDGINFEKKISALIEYKIPVNVENDGKAATLAELWLGELKGISEGAVIVLGTGVGCGIVLDGKVISGKNYQAGEVSFMVNNATLPDYKGYVGYSCSAVQMIQKVNYLEAHNKLDDGKEAFNYIKEDRPQARKVFDNYCENVATLIQNIQAVVDVEKIVIGGGISEQTVLVENIKKQYRKRLQDVPLFANMITQPQIVCAKFKSDANLYGALYGLLLKIGGIIDEDY